MTLEGSVVGVHAEVFEDVLLFREFFGAAFVLALECGRISVSFGVKNSLESVPISWNTFEPFWLFLIKNLWRNEIVRILYATWFGHIPIRSIVNFRCLI